MKHAWVVLVAACGGAAPIEHAGYVAAFAHAMCEREFSCCSAAQAVMDFHGVEIDGEPIDTEPQCETWMTAVYQAIDKQDFMPGLAAGRMAWDADGAGACVDAIAHTACGDFQLSAFPTSCGAFWGPQVADGASCGGSLECTSGWCTAYDDEGSVGSCAAPPGAGELCTGTCSSGLVCKDTCIPPLQAGEACDRRDQCESNDCTDNVCIAARVCK